MPIPDYQTLMLPLLTLAAKGETRVPDVAEQIANNLGLSQMDRDELLPSGRQRLLHNRLHWAKLYLQKAGLIASQRRGLFSATNAGQELLAQNPTRIDVSTLMRYPKFVQFYEGGEKQEGVPRNEEPVPPIGVAKTTPEEQIETASNAIKTALRDDLLQHVLQSSPAFFEQVIIGLLLAMGYGGSQRDAAKQLGRSGDGGVDGIINEDRLGLDRVYVQAKRWTNTVGRPEVQSFVGSLVGLNATKGVMVTTSSFTPQALAYIKGLSQRVILIDGQTLASLMIEYNVGVRVSRTIDLKRLDEDFFSENE